MARRSGVIADIARVQREMERQRAAQVRAQAAATREMERTRREHERARIANEKEQVRTYQNMRLAEVASENESLNQRIEFLNSLLLRTLRVNDALDFNAMKRRTPTPAFEPGVLATPVPPPDPAAFQPPETGFVSRLLPGARAKQDTIRQQAQAAYDAACAEHAANETSREAALAAAQERHATVVATQQRQDETYNAGIDAFRESLANHEPDAVIEYATLVLLASVYPDGFPQHAQLAYVPESRQLVVDYDLPPLDVVPSVLEMKYVKSSDTITNRARPATQIRSLYASVIAQVTLRTIHELFEADQQHNLDSIAFNGHVRSVDPGTGRDIRPCLVSVRTTRDQFEAIDLARVEPAACLAGLNATVSRTPHELAPVRPIIEFNMVDKRFIEEVDMLSDIDSRTNLMDLSPTEFEALISNLFTKMGLESRLTRASRDGGVDCVAFDSRPIVGGKIVIQAKRYKNTVDVAAVRELFGTMQSERANKGILVTTSGYGKAAMDFANDKPIELISGSHLLHLLEEYAGIEARIIFPVT